MARREQVYAAKPPEGTRTYHPIAHGTFLDCVHQAASQAGLEVVQEVHSLSHEGLRYFGMMELYSDRADYSTVLGLRNSNDKRFPAGAVVGSGVFVCDNLCFSGEVKFGRKHTPNILRDLPTLIRGSFVRIEAMQAWQDKRISTYKETELARSQVHDLLIEAYDKKVISSSKIGQVLEEYREPRHQEFRAGPTAWRLMNAFTEVMKPRQQGDDLFNLPAKTEALHGILDAACDITADQEYLDAALTN